MPVEVASAAKSGAFNPVWRGAGRLGSWFFAAGVAGWGRRAAAVGLALASLVLKGAALLVWQGGLGNDGARVGLTFQTDAWFHGSMQARAYYKVMLILLELIMIICYIMLISL